MAVKTFKWLKLYNNFFTDPKMKKLRRIAGGDTYTCIYLKMMLASINTDGVLEYEGIEPTIEAELALKLDEEETNVKVVLSFLQAQNIAEVEKNIITFPNLPDLIGEETESAIRMRKMRQKNRQQNLLASQSDVAVTAELQDSSLPVTTEKELESEKELDTSLLLSPSEERESFKTTQALKKHLIKKYDNTGVVWQGIAGYTSLTIRNGYLHNTVSQKDLTGEEAVAVWGRIFNYYREQGAVA